MDRGATARARFVRLLEPERPAPVARVGEVLRWAIAAGVISARRARCCPGERLDVGEHAAGVPGGEGSDEPRRAVELDAAVAGGLGPGELASVPFDEGFGFRRDVKVLVEAGGLLADLGVGVLYQQPV